jgi:hypothetical protein
MKLMKRTIEEYLVGDEVDVFPDGDSLCSEEFTGRITSIDLENDIITVKDLDDDVWDMSPHEIQPTHNHDDEEDYSKLIAY